MFYYLKYQSFSQPPRANEERAMAFKRLFVSTQCKTITIDDIRVQSLGVESSHFQLKTFFSKTH